MKASIDERGCLKVAPENALESFALKQWWDGWDKSTGTQTSTLHIEVVNRIPSNEEVTQCKPQNP